jgi:hypothetical protein
LLEIKLWLPWLFSVEELSPAETSNHETAYPVGGYSTTGQKVECDVSVEAPENPGIKLRLKLYELDRVKHKTKQSVIANEEIDNFAIEDSSFATVSKDPTTNIPKFVRMGNENEKGNGIEKYVLQFKDTGNKWNERRLRGVQYSQRWKDRKCVK